MNNIKKSAENLQKYGRNGDTLLAHITPAEANLLKAFGGSGTINPTTGLPEYYRVNGPTVSILQMLQDVCDVLGYDFFVYLNSSNVIKIGLVDLRNPPSSFDYIINSYDGLATDLSYGQELRNEKTRSLIFGEKRHYISVATVFNHYFGEDLYGEEYVPVVPPKILLLPPSIVTVLTQLSEDGVSFITPFHSTILNGLTFSTLDANGCSIQDFSEYFSVIKLPVF